MNQSQIHLALTHMPVILSLTGLVILIVSLVRNNPTVTKISFYILIAAGLFALPVFFTGEGAEETVEHLPGISDAIIEDHETIAKISLIIVLATALLAAAGLIRIAMKPMMNVVKYVVLLLSVVSTGLMLRTAHLGGQIRHTEIRATLADENPVNEQDGKQASEAAQKNEKKSVSRGLFD